MYTEKDLKNCEYIYNKVFSEWVAAKRDWLSSISCLRENKKHLSLKQYNEVKHLTKQTRINLQQNIEKTFQVKIKAHEKILEVQKYLASKQHDHNNDLFLEVLGVLENMTQEQKDIFMKMKHKINC